LKILGIGAGLKWLLRIIGAGIVSYSLNFIFEGRIWSWIWKLLGNFVNLLITHWMTLVPLVFGMLFAILIALIYFFKFYRFKKYIAMSLKDNFRKDLRPLNHKISHLERYFAMSFEDDFQGGLEKNWHYADGQWKIVNGNKLSVTQSEVGGISKVGHLWTDYSFEFTAIIVNRCIGWIVRAQDLFNYYMIQLNPDVEGPYRRTIRPHIRIGGRWTVLPGKKYNLSIKLNQPIKICTEVKGMGIRVYVNNEEMYSNEEFFCVRFINEAFTVVPFQANVVAVLPFTRGRIGFRVASKEHGKFSGCRVRPLQ